jgi:hypothetical protein
MLRAPCLPTLLPSDVAAPAIPISSNTCAFRLRAPCLPLYPCLPLQMLRPVPSPSDVAPRAFQHLCLQMCVRAFPTPVPHAIPIPSNTCAFRCCVLRAFPFRCCVPRAFQHFYVDQNWSQMSAVQNLLVELLDLPQDLLLPSDVACRAFPTPVPHAIPIPCNTCAFRCCPLPMPFRSLPTLVPSDVATFAFRYAFAFRCCVPRAFPFRCCVPRAFQHFCLQMLRVVPPQRPCPMPFRYLPTLLPSTVADHAADAWGLTPSTNSAAFRSPTSKDKLSVK